VAADASPDDITRAYRRRARDTHPDRHPDDASAAQRFCILAAAYDQLSDASRRAAYDRERLPRPPWPPSGFYPERPQGTTPLRVGRVHVEPPQPSRAVRVGVPGAPWVDLTAMLTSLFPDDGVSR